MKFRSGIYIEYPKKRILLKSTNDITHVFEDKTQFTKLNSCFFTLCNVSKVLSLSSGVYAIDIFSKETRWATNMNGTRNKGTKY